MRIGYDFFSIPLPNLRKWEIDHTYEELGDPQVQWRLETLKLHFHGDQRPVGYSSLFQVHQEKFASPLVSLDLAMGTAESKKERRKLRNYSENSRLDLPKLGKVEIGMLKNQMCLDLTVGACRLRDSGYAEGNIDKGNYCPVYEICEEYAQIKCLDDF